MNKREQKFTTKLMKWLKYNEPYSAAIEVKNVNEKRFYFNSGNSFRKQLRNLKLARGKIVYKNSDLDRLGNPFDIFMINDGRGVFIFNWYEEKSFYLIDVFVLDGFIKEGNKSLTKEDAKRLCFKKGILKT